jgi:hypothetical protein
VKGNRNLPANIAVLSLLPEAKRSRFESYWDAYRGLPGSGSQDDLRLRATIAAGVMLPSRSTLNPSTALAVASGLLQYHPPLANGLAEAFDALSSLHGLPVLRQPMGTYVLQALEELSFRFAGLALELTRKNQAV